MAKTTKKDFQLFKDSAEKWRVKLGLMNWGIYYEHVLLEDAYARTNWSTNAMAATLQLSTKWDQFREVNNVEIEKVALHEILHVLLAPLISEAEYRYSTSDAIASAEHSIVRTLEGTMI